MSPPTLKDVCMLSKCDPFHKWKRELFAVQDGTAPINYNDFCRYLTEKSDQMLSCHLSFAGRNRVLFTLPTIQSKTAGHWTRMLIRKESLLSRSWFKRQSVVDFGTSLNLQLIMFYFCCELFWHVQYFYFTFLFLPLWHLRLSNF